MDLGVAAAVALNDRAEHGEIGGKSGHADALPLELARARDLALGDHRRQRLLHEGADSDQVLPLLARETEVVDVDDRKVGASRRQELERVGRRRRLAHDEVDPVRAVALVGDRLEDPGVRGVRREVERRRNAGRPLAAPAAC